MKSDVINALHLPTGAWRVWVEGHPAVTITANSKPEAVGLLVLNWPVAMGCEVRETGAEAAHVDETGNVYQ